MAKIKWRADQLKLFWYWINERHQIYVNKKSGAKWPWTKDKILQTYKFTNVFRQLDRTTEEWTKRFVTLLGQGKNVKDGDLLFQCAMFRLFNWPGTYDTLYYNMPKWDKAKAIELLTKRMEEDREQIFTGAYIIPNAGRTDPKIQVICEALDYLYDGRTDKEIEKGRKPRRTRFAKKILAWQSMEDSTWLLQKVPTIGGFIGYEIACDLRHTRLLADARDIRSWANPGPGAIRGINRLLTGQRRIKDRKHGGPRTPEGKLDYVASMHALLQLAPERIGAHVKSCEWPFEMREIEHSLCEFDKYMRVKLGEGKPRSKYYPKLNGSVPWDEDLPEGEIDGREDSVQGSDEAGGVGGDGERQAGVRDDGRGAGADDAVARGGSKKSNPKPHNTQRAAGNDSADKRRSRARNPRKKA